jgi:hypothetical protein
LVRNSLTSNWILAVERQRQIERLSADGPDRHALDVLVLGCVLPDPEHLADRRELRVAERQRGDALGRREVALEQYRRDAEHVGVVVEAAGGIVGRQHGARVDVQIEQIANRVGVLAAVETMRQRRPGWARPARRDRAAFEERDERGLRRGRRRGTPGGGIIPPRTLRITFSHTSACAAGRSRSRRRA